MNDFDEPIPRIFDADRLSRMPICEGGAVEFDKLENTGRIGAYPKENGPAERWVAITKDRPGDFVIGAAVRPSEGFAPGWAVACVLDRRTGKQAAQIREQLPAPQFAKNLALAGRYYNWAFLLPHASLIEGLQRADYPADRIFPGFLKPGRPQPWTIMPGEIGVEFTRTSSPRLITALANGIRGIGQQIILRSSIARDECLNFVVRPDGKQGPRIGSDACVWALALAAFGLEYAPREQPYSQLGVKRLAGGASPWKFNDPRQE